MFSLQHEYYEKTGSVNCFSPRLYYRWENEAGINDKNKIYGNFEKKGAKFFGSVSIYNKYGICITK